MKKNLMIKVASLMLVLTLASTCMIGTTFAKYVTGDQASDTARVAKWGITVSTSGTLFGTDYEEYSAADTADRITAVTSTSVSASNANSIVAPGTKNTVGFQVAVKGDPEVKYDTTAAKVGTISDIVLKEGNYGLMVKVPENAAINVDTDFTANKIYKSSDETTFTKVSSYVTLGTGENFYRLIDTANVAADYYPITWTVTKTGTALADIATTKNLDTILGEMVTNISGLDGNANAEVNSSYTLTWEWAFEVNEATNKMDTILGHLAADVADDGMAIVKTNDDFATVTIIDSADYNLTINFGLSVSVQQVD